MKFLILISSGAPMFLLMSKQSQIYPILPFIKLWNYSISWSRLIYLKTENMVFVGHIDMNFILQKGLRIKRYIKSKFRELKHYLRSKSQEIIRYFDSMVFHLTTYNCMELLSEEDDVFIPRWVVLSFWNTVRDLEKTLLWSIHYAFTLR